MYLIDDVGLVGNCILQNSIPFILLLLGDHEETKLLKVRFEIVSVLLFLKLTKLAIFHIRYYFKFKANPPIIFIQLKCISCPQNKCKSPTCFFFHLSNYTVKYVTMVSSVLNFYFVKEVQLPYLRVHSSLFLYYYIHILHIFKTGLRQPYLRHCCLAYTHSLFFLRLCVLFGNIIVFSRNWCAPHSKHYNIQPQINI